jgi:hypothetical protein
MVQDNLPDKDSVSYANLQLQFALKMLDPENHQSLASICHEFNKRYRKQELCITIKTLLKWKRDPVYIARKNAMVQRIEEQYAGDIDKKLIELCLRGSFPHMNLWYNKRGELITKHQMVSSDALPKDKKGIDKEIERLIAVTTPLESNE